MIDQKYKQPKSFWGGSRLFVVFNNAKSFDLNVVWRWEYRPGSVFYVFYLVWTQVREGDHQDYFTSARRDFRETFSLPAEDIVLLKASY